MPVYSRSEIGSHSIHPSTLLRKAKTPSGSAEMLVDRSIVNIEVGATQSAVAENATETTITIQLTIRIAEGSPLLLRSMVIA